MFGVLSLGTCCGPLCPVYFCRRCYLARPDLEAQASNTFASSFSRTAHYSISSSLWSEAPALLLMPRYLNKLPFRYHNLMWNWKTISNYSQNDSHFSSCQRTWSEYWESHSHWSTILMWCLISTRWPYSGLLSALSCSGWVRRAAPSESIVLYPRS